MPEQLDLFAAQLITEPDPVAKATEKLIHRKLRPPVNIEAPEFEVRNTPIAVPFAGTAKSVETLPPAEETLPTGREILKAEARKIADMVVEPSPVPVTLKREKSLPEQPAETHVIAKEDKPKTNRGRKSIKEMSKEADLPEIPEDDILFGKQYYGIGEVAAMFHVNASLLRYWESEFDILKPRKNGKGDRFFRPEDIKNLQVIHHLLRQKKFTIEGAKDYLKNNKKSQEKFEMVKQLQQLRNFLLEMKAGLK